MPSISEISITIRAVTRPFVRGLKRATMQIKKFTSAVFGGLLRGLLKFGAILTGLATGAFVIFLKKQAEALDRLAKFSRALKVTSTFVNGLRFAATQSGVSIENIDKSMQRFVKVLGEAQLGIGTGVTAFKALGAQVKDRD